MAIRTWTLSGEMTSHLFAIIQTLSTFHSTLEATFLAWT